jgi:hypothetical protein
MMKNNEYAPGNSVNVEYGIPTLRTTAYNRQVRVVY